MVATQYEEYLAVLSPDDRFLAYTSDVSGRHEVYVRSFPDGDREWMISTGGGGGPRWRGDGQELYFLEPDGTLCAVPIQLSPQFQLGKPERLFQDDTLVSRGAPYDAAPDGQRFVVIKVLEKPKSAIRVVENWFTEIRELGGGAR